MAEHPEAAPDPEAPQISSYALHAELLGLEWRGNRADILTTAKALVKLATRGATDRDEAMATVLAFAEAIDRYEDTSADIIILTGEKKYAKGYAEGYKEGVLDTIRGLTADDE